MEPGCSVCPFALSEDLILVATAKHKVYLRKDSLI